MNALLVSASFLTRDTAVGLSFTPHISSFE